MSQAMDDLKSWLLNGAATAVKEAAAACAGRPDAEAGLLRLQAAQRTDFELHGMGRALANGLATAFAALVRERMAASG